MTGGFEVWGPPLVVLVVGLVGGLLWAFLLRNKGEASQREQQANREALLAEKESLLEQLRSLEADRSNLPENERLARREVLLQAAAAVVERLAGPEVPVAETTVSPETEKKQNRAALQAGLMVAGLLGFVALLFVGIDEAAKPRQAGAGMVGGSQAASPGAVEAAEAKARLAENPSDIAAIHVLTYEAILAKNLDEAMGLIEQARKIEPESPELWLHLGILRMTVGMMDEAAASISKAADARPDWGRPLLWRGLVRMYEGNSAAAIPDLEAALAKGLRADEQDAARQLLAEARNPRPAAAPAAAPANAGPTYSGAGGGAPQLAGTVSLAAGLSPDPGQVVFVMVYANGEGRPPPVATLRITAGDLPFEMKFEEGHGMTGGPWPAQFWVKARLDADGRPGSSPGDLDSALTGPLTPGASGVRLEIAPAG